MWHSWLGDLCEPESYLRFSKFTVWLWQTGENHHDYKRVVPTRQSKRKILCLEASKGPAPVSVESLQWWAVTATNSEWMTFKRELLWDCVSRFSLSFIYVEIRCCDYQIDNYYGWVCMIIIPGWIIFARLHHLTNDEGHLIITFKSNQRLCKPFMCGCTTKWKSFKRFCKNSAFHQYLQKFIGVGYCRNTFVTIQFCR